MKHLKSFKQLTEGLSNKMVNLEINNIVNSIFDCIKSKDVFNDFINNTLSLEIAHSIYDSFVDAAEILELRQDDLQMFADNLGVGDSPNLLLSIMENMYEEKTNRNYFDDIEKHISDLNKVVDSLDDDLGKCIMDYKNILKKL